MKILKYLVLIIVMIVIFVSCGKKQISEQTEFGELMHVYLDNAPFPDEDRKSGHTYEGEFFPYEGHYDDNTVAILIPNGYNATDETDFVIHFHGWNNSVDSVLSQFELLKQFGNSQRNAILIVPQGPKYSKDSYGGKLSKDGGFDRFMNEIVELLKKEKKIPQDSKLHKMVLTAHSGGYKVVSDIVSKNKNFKKIKEVYLFDALYGETTKFLDWVNVAGHKFFVLYTDDGGTMKETKKLSKILQGAGFPYHYQHTRKIKQWELIKNPIMILHSDLGHNDVIHKRNMYSRILKNGRLKAIKKKK
ncbi:MAG: hypothetical protein U9N76_03655 [Candidatus Marinimicrobia bacterium]|nr:hypothetical protein [Candidatus Neomarinimicrobiota bacterium]